MLLLKSLFIWKGRARNIYAAEGAIASSISQAQRTFSNADTLEKGVVNAYRRNNVLR
jgi:hypothetical protein